MNTCSLPNGRFPLNLTICPLCASNDNSRVTEENGYEVARCHVCGVIYVVSPPSLEGLKALYEADQAARIHTGAAIRLRGKRIIVAKNDLKLIKQYVRGGHLLEVGCAAGYFLEYAQQHGFEATGLELNDRFVEYATRELGLRVLQGTLTIANLPKQSFDAIYMRNVLSHLIDPIGDFRIIRDLLRDDGYLFFETGNLAELSPEQIRKHQKLCPLGVPDHRLFLSRQNVRYLAEVTGLEIVSCQAFSTVVHDWFSHLLEDRGRRMFADARPQQGGASSRKENVMSWAWYFLLYQLGRVLPKEGYPCTVKYVCKPALPSVS